MTFLSPLLFAALMLGPVIMMQMDTDDLKKIAIIDDTKTFGKLLPDTKSLKFEIVEGKNLDNFKGKLEESGYYAVLVIPNNITNKQENVFLYSDKQSSLDVNEHISRNLEKAIEKEKLKANGIDEDLLAKSKKNINVRTKKWNKDGEVKESSTELASGISYASGFLIYMFIFMYGVQVMRGVIEEKANRIIEVIISSVKPFQLMLGKILGIACVGLTQFLAWVILTGLIAMGGQFLLLKDKNPEELQKNLTENVMDANPVSGVIQTQPEAASLIKDNPLLGDALAALGNLPLGQVIGMFLFYFLGGYLLYSAMFAIIGSAVDNETDTQQFMAPVTIPLILGIFVMMSVIKSPEGALAFWFSMIPFTSPIVMMARIPFGVPVWQLALSATLLVATFLAMTWFAAKIYRTGILMYGKKASYKELWKWIKY